MDDMIGGEARISPPRPKIGASRPPPRFMGRGDAVRSIARSARRSREPGNPRTAKAPNGPRPFSRGRTYPASEAAKSICR